jgi:hypothetical protein
MTVGCILLLMLCATATPARADITLTPAAARHESLVFDLASVRPYRLAKAVLLPGRKRVRKRRLAAAASRGRLVVGRRLFDPPPPAHAGKRKLRHYRLRIRVARSSRLLWAPPSLSNPVTVEAAGADRHGDIAHQLDLSPSRDYIVRMPPGPLPGGLTIQGGHNVVLIGGEIDVPMQPGPSPSPESRRGLYLTEQTGTAHVEGLLIRGPDLSEGIDLSEPDGAVVQVENVRVEGVHARDETHFSDNHPDVLQTWAGPAELRVDRLSGSTDYQGLFLAPNQFGLQPPPRQVTLSRVDLQPISMAQRCSCYLLWEAGSFPIRSTDVWLIPHPSRSFAGSVWPSVASWAGVMDGAPPRGQFVPVGVAGPSYLAPGYR